MPKWAIDITAGTGGFEAAMQRVQKSVKGAADDGTVSLKGLGLAGTAAIGSIVGAAAGLYGIATTIAGWHDEIDDVAASTGLAAETVQGLQLHAEATGTEFGALAAVAKKIPKLMGDAANGSKAAARGFAGLGVEVRDSTGQLRSSDEVFRDVIAGMGSIEDPTERAAAAMQLFGRQGSAALEAFGTGSALFEQHVKIAEKYGISTAHEASDAAARLQEEIARLGLVARGAGDDLWAAFGGQDGALGAVRAMTSGIVFAGDMLVELRKSFELPGWEMLTGVGGLWTGIKNIGHTADAWEHASAAAQEYLNDADATDRIAGAASSAVAALGDEIETTARKTRAAQDPQQVYAEQLAQIAGIQADLTEDTLTDSQRITQAWIRQTEPLVTLVEQYDAQGEVAEAAMSALADAEARLQRDRLALEEERIAEEERLRQQDYDRLEAERAADLARVQGYADAELRAKWALADQIVGMASFVGSSLAQSERRQWAWQQAGALAQAGINLWQGISEASASAPPPWNAIPIAAATMQGMLALGQIAAVRPPSAYTGIDLPYASTQGTPIIAHPGESVRTRSETERDRRPKPSYTEVWIGGRRVAAAVTEDTRAGGPLSAEMRRRGGRLGHAPGWR